VAEARRRRLRALRRQLTELRGQQTSSVTRVLRRLRQVPLIRRALSG
jgi:hypothetical protein